VVKFRFRASAPMSSFRCRLDGRPFGPCDASNSHKLGPLASGRHAFEVVATDPFGATDPSPARHEFEIVRR
jgi:hypothetical protein